MVGSHTKLYHATKQIINLTCYKEIKFELSYCILCILCILGHSLIMFSIVLNIFILIKRCPKLYSHKNGPTISQTLIHVHKTLPTYPQHTLVNLIIQTKIQHPTFIYIVHKPYHPTQSYHKVVPKLIHKKKNPQSYKPSHMHIKPHSLTLDTHWPTQSFKPTHNTQHSTPIYILHKPYPLHILITRLPLNLFIK